MQRKMAGKLGWGTALTVVGATAAAVSFSTDTQACGLPYERNIYLYPLDKDAEVPTNAKLLGVRNTPSGEYWLRKVIAPTDFADAQAGSGGSADVELQGDADLDAAAPRVNGLDAGLQGTEEVPVSVECVERAHDRVCIGSAALEPYTRYVWGATDATDYEEPQWFTTGGGTRDPETVPELSFEVLNVRPSAGGGDCAAIKEGTVEVSVSPTSDPWIFIPENPNDLPARIEGEQPQFTWSTIDPDDCMGAEQMNWAGEVFNANVEVCLPSATDAGPDSGGGDEGSTSPEAGPHDSSEQGSPDTAPTSEASTSDAFTSAIVDASSPTPDSDAGADTGGLAGTDEAGCSCRAGTRSPSTAAGWAGVLLLGWAARRRQRG